MMFLGIRLEDTPLGEFPDGVSYPDDIPTGSYWKVMSRKDPTIPLTPDDLKHTGNPGLTNTVWGVITPNGLYGMLSIHTVREEDDGTISIRAGDGSSNSVLISWDVTDRPELSKSWHGYIEHGVWNEC